MKKHSSLKGPAIKLGLSGAFVYIFLATDLFVVGLASLFMVLILGMAVAREGSRLFDQKPSGVHIQLISAGVGMCLLSLYLMLESFLYPFL